jgi:hypothetical protein
MRWLPLVLPLLLLSAVGARAADMRTEIVASAEAFCPPCRRALVMGAPANARGMMTMRLVPPTGGAPPQPWTQSFTADSAGFAETWFPMWGPGLYVVDTTVDGRAGRPAFIVSDCGPPWAPTPPIDCPPPSPWRGVRGDDILALLSRHPGADLRAILERLGPGRTPRWIHVRTSRVRVGSDGQVKVQARDVLPGIYRVRFVDRQENTVATSLAEIQPRRP